MLLARSVMGTEECSHWASLVREFPWASPDGAEHRHVCADCAVGWDLLSAMADGVRADRVPEIAPELRTDIRNTLIMHATNATPMPWQRMSHVAGTMLFTAPALFLLALVLVHAPGVHAPDRPGQRVDADRGIVDGDSAARDTAFYSTSWIPRNYDDHDGFANFDGPSVRQTGGNALPFGRAPGHPSHSGPSRGHPGLSASGTNDVGLIGGRAEAVFERGWRAVRRADFSAAAKHFNRVASLSPPASIAEDALYWRGIALGRSGKSAEAVESYSEFLHQFPDSERSGEVAVAQGWALLRLGNDADARHAFRRGLSAAKANIRYTAKQGLSRLRSALPADAPQRRRSPSGEGKGGTRHPRS